MSDLISIVTEGPKLLLLTTIFAVNGYCQSIERPLTKVGGFIYLYHFSEYSGFSVNVERERVFRRNHAFSQGLRLDYDMAKPRPQTYFPGVENLIVGYEFKAYPFHGKNKTAYNGFFIGLDPCYFVKVKNRYKYGPGLGSIVGYQLWIKARFALSSEASMIYMQNVSDSAPRSNPNDRYFYFFANIKAGWRL